MLDQEEEEDPFQLSTDEEEPTITPAETIEPTPPAPHKVSVFIAISCDGIEVDHPFFVMDLSDELRKGWSYFRRTIDNSIKAYSTRRGPTFNPIACKVVARLGNLKTPSNITIVDHNT